MRTILLYGFLGKRFGRVHQYDVKTPAEAIRALCATLEGFQQAVISGGCYRLLVAGKESLNTEQIANPCSHRESIRLIPTISGSSGGIGQIIVGSLLIAASFVAGAMGFPKVAAYMFKAGVVMVIGGVAQMLFAPPPPNGPADKADNKPSYTFNGAVNTAAQGNPVSILYGGPLIVGSQVISAGLSVVQI